MIPALVLVNGRVYRLQVVADLEEYGHSDPDNAAINIREGLDLFTERDTVLHELMHAVLRQQGRVYTPSEERYVTALATGLTGLFADNPAILDYLTNKGFK